MTCQRGLEGTERTTVSRAALRRVRVSVHVKGRGRQFTKVVDVAHENKGWGGGNTLRALQVYGFMSILCGF